MEIEQTIPTKDLQGNTIGLSHDYLFKPNKGDRHSPSQSAGELKRTYGNYPQFKEELFSTLFMGNDNHWYHLSEDKNGVWSWKAQGLSDQQHTTQYIAHDEDNHYKISLIPSHYKNPYELNKAIEDWIEWNIVDTGQKLGQSATLDKVNSRQYTIEEKMFIKAYSGYGGLSKYGDIGKEGNYEFYTPKLLIEKMWALAYKHGYTAKGSVLEPSVGTGEFLQFVDPEALVRCFEINIYSAIITKILYPQVEIKVQPFEEHFIESNDTIKNKLDKKTKFDLVIGNPPYADFQHNMTRYMAMGEKDYTGATNYVDYFISRGIDLVKPGGLLIYVIGAEVMGGGQLWLDTGDSKVKQHINDVAELVEAYRLPNNVFERTLVTSDIIVLKKK